MQEETTENTEDFTRDICLTCHQEICFEDGLWLHEDGSLAHAALPKNIVARLEAQFGPTSAPSMFSDARINEKADRITALLVEINQKHNIGAESLGRLSLAIADLRDEAVTREKKIRDVFGENYTEFSFENCWRTITGLTLKYATARDEIKRLHNLINTPHTEDFVSAVKIEAAHQIDRWGTDHDAGKTPLDYYWLVGYLAGKIVFALLSENYEKAQHHCISTSALMLNWYRRIRGEEFKFQPGAVPRDNDF